MKPKNLISVEDRKIALQHLIEGWRDTDDEYQVEEIQHATDDLDAFYVGDEEKYLVLHHDEAYERCEKIIRNNLEDLLPRIIALCEFKEFLAPFNYEEYESEDLLIYQLR